MEDYRKLAMEAAATIPHQTHSELLNSADKIHAWLTQNRKEVEPLVLHYPEFPYCEVLPMPPYKKAVQWPNPGDLQQKLAVFNYTGVPYARDKEVVRLRSPLCPLYPPFKNEKSPSDVDEDN